MAAKKKVARPRRKFLKITQEDFNTKVSQAFEDGRRAGANEELARSNNRSVAHAVALNTHLNGVVRTLSDIINGNSPVARSV